MAITWGSPRSKPSGAGTGPWYADPYLWMNVAGTAADAWASQNSAHQANRTNIQLQREQRDWQERMAGSEIQRRKRDIELAGGNPALAFTEGSGASTPSVSAPTVEPTFRPGGLAGLSTAAQVAANVQNVRADTLNKVASARIQNVEADIREGGKKQEAAARVNANLESVEWNDLKTEILRSQNISSAAEAKRAGEAVDAVIRQAKALAATQELTEKNLRRIVEMQGLSWKDVASIILQIAK